MARIPLGNKDHKVFVGRTLHGCPSNLWLVAIQARDCPIDNNEDLCLWKGLVVFLAKVIGKKKLCTEMNV